MGCEHAQAAGGQSTPSQFEENTLSEVKRVIAVLSGKGGVGKSFVTGAIATELARRGNKVGILDADITGPSIPKMFGMSGRHVHALGNLMLPEISEHGVKVMSSNLLLQNETDPVLWRGPVIAGAIRQFWSETSWGPIDYLLVDMPPGTGDIQLTLSQQVPLTGAVVVTTPQDIALIDAKKGLRMFQKVNVPILGIIENMSVFICPHCGEVEHIFGEGGAKRMSEQYGVPLLGELPLSAKIREQADSGLPTVAAEPDGKEALMYREMAMKVAGALARITKDYTAKMPGIRVVND